MLTAPVFQHLDLALLLRVASSVLLIFVPPTFLQRVCECVCIMWKRGVKCKENPNFLKVIGNVWVTMVKCACGPGQQHFPAGRSWSSCCIVHLIVTATSSCDFKLNSVRCWNLSICLWPTRTKTTHILRREWVTRLKKIFKIFKKCVNKEQPFF